MLFRFTMNNVVITETTATGTTTAKIENLSLQNECKPEEVRDVITCITTSKKNNRTAKKNTSKRYHVVKTHDYNNGFNILWYVWDRRTNSYYIKVGSSNADIMSASYFTDCINEHKHAHRVIAEYDCNNFRL